MLAVALGLRSSPIVRNYATLNPADKEASITLSGGNLIAAVTETVSKCRSTIGKASGKWYWEYTQSTTSPGPIGGAATSASVLTMGPGMDGASWGVYGPDGNKYTSNVGALYMPSFTTETIGVALDMDARTIGFFRTGVYQGTAFTGLPGTIFAAVGSSGGLASSFVLNFGATQFAHTPPAGFNPGLYS
jgi:acyl-homoserine lactone acylase PvdQ